MMQCRLRNWSKGVFIGIVLVLSGFLVQTGSVLGGGGDLLWDAQFDKADGNDYGRAMVTKGNTIFAIGYGENASGNYDIITLAYDAKTGNLLWESQFDKAGGDDYGRAIAIKGNTLFITGYCTNASGNYDVITLAYDARTGDLLWWAQFDKAGGDDYGIAIAMGSNAVFVTGYCRNASGNDDIITLAYEARTGNLLWWAQFDKAGGRDWGNAIAIKGNSIFVTGVGTNLSGNWDIVTLAYDARTGTLLWDAQFDKAGGYDRCYGIAMKGNTLFVTGNGTNASGNTDIITLAYDARTGDLLWDAQFDKAGGNDEGYNIAVKGNSIFVTGVGTNLSGNLDIITLAYDSRTGDLLWEAQFDYVGATDRIEVITIKGSTILLAGFGINASGNSDIFTLAYDTRTGNLLWDAQFDKAGGNDGGYGIAIIGNTLFVTGTVVNVSGNNDFAILAYDIN